MSFRREIVGSLPAFLMDSCVSCFHIFLCVDAVRGVHDFVSVFPQVETHDPKKLFDQERGPV